MELVRLLMTTVMLPALTRSSDLIEKAVSIANDVYKPYLLTAVAWWNDDHALVNEFLRNYLGSVRTINVEKCDEFCRKSFKVKQTVVFANNPEEFDSILSISNNVTTKAIVVILVILNDYPASDLNDYTKIALQKDVEDIVAISLKLDGTISVSTVIPYGGGVCRDATPREVTIRQSKIFKENKYNNFHGCPIRVSAIEFMPYVKLIQENDTVIALDGIDANFVNLVIKSLNATLYIASAANHGDLGYYINGTASGSLGDLYYNVADIVAPALILTSERYPATQMTSIHRPSYVVLCLPKREEIYKLFKVFLPFYNWSTPMIIAAAIGIYTTLRFVNKFGQREYKLPQRIPFGIFSLFFGQFYNVNAKYWLINAIFNSWIWFSLIFRISYEGRLVEGLHHVILEPPVTTFDEAIRGIDEVRIHPTFLEFYRNTAIEKVAVAITIPDLKKTLFAIEAGKKFLVAAEIGQVKLYKKEVQILEERSINSPAAICLRPRWPAAKYVSTVILRSVDTGQMHKIMDDFYAGWELQNLNKTVSLHVKRLGMDILGSCFIGLILMYILCCIVFGVELFYKYYVTRRDVIFLP